MSGSKNIIKPNERARPSQEDGNGASWVAYRENSFEKGRERKKERRHRKSKKASSERRGYGIN
jgi:hypothetical protein